MIFLSKCKDEKNTVLAADFFHFPNFEIAEYPRIFQQLDFRFQMSYICTPKILVFGLIFKP
ncbi:hypothetical protein EGI11_00825 [Chryseobacterium sp. H3056]|uniref:Uncharacterized protein n=1 Tax=Kaistella daneshvariae TaxID=2487074 RepID=A0A3N0WZF4_9FLAO|nr:hypothetical protein EGI11_00825 [Kaistella daneshvariae]